MADISFPLAGWQEAQGGDCRALSSQRGGGNGLLCWPCFSLCHLQAAGVLCPVQMEAWFLVCSQTKAGERPQPRPASGTLRAAVDVRVLVARGVSSAPPAWSLRALFPPAQYQDPTSLQSVLETPGPKGLPGLRIPIDPRLLASSPPLGLSGAQLNSVFSPQGPWNLSSPGLLQPLC